MRGKDMTEETRNDIIAFAVEKDLCERMDMWIANHVMGWTLDPPNDTSPNFPASRQWWRNANGNAQIPDGEFSPTTNRSDALDALEAWCDADAKNLRYDLLRVGWIDESYICRLIDISSSSLQVGGAQSSVRCLAICRALCKATGMPEGGEDDE